MYLGSVLPSVASVSITTSFTVYLCHEEAETKLSIMHVTYTYTANIIIKGSDMDMLIIMLTNESRAKR